MMQFVVFAKYNPSYWCFSFTHTCSMCIYTHFANIHNKSRTKGSLFMYTTNYKDFSTMVYDSVVITDNINILHFTQGTKNVLTQPYCIYDVKWVGNHK